MSIGSAGDLYPFLSLSKALQHRGHRVTFLSSPFHAALVLQAGVVFHGIGTNEQYLAAVNDPDLWHPRKSVAVLFRDFRSCIQQILKFFASLSIDERCVLLAHPLMLPAAAIARGIRPDLQIIGAYLAPSNLRTCHNPLIMGPMPIPRWFPMAWRQWLWSQVDTRMIDPFVLPDLNAERQSLGLRPVKHLMEHVYSIADFSVTLFPSWFSKQQPDWPHPLYMGDFQLYEPDPNRVVPAELVRFLAAGDRPVVFTAGTEHRHATRYFANALEAVKQLGLRAVFLTMHRNQVPADLPSTVLWQGYVSLRKLLPHVSALVHHGGIGTTAEALRAGVPQLIVPFAHDQFDNGARVRELEVGKSLPASRLRTGNLVRMLRKILTSSAIQAQCRAAAKRFAPAPNAEALSSAIETAVGIGADECVLT